MKNPEEIVYVFQRNTSNQSLFFKTFNIINVVYFENFLDCKLSSDNYIEEFENSSFINLRNDILIKGGKANFNFKEFTLLLKSFKFVAKYFEMEPSEKLSKILKSNNYPNAVLYKNSKDYGSNFNFENEKKWYLDKINEIFENYNKSITDKKLLLSIDSELEKFTHK